MSYFPHPDRFERRHIGPDSNDLQAMLHTLKVSSLDELIDQTIPSNIRLHKPLRLPPAQSEYEYLTELKNIARLNRVARSYIGMGYYGTITPSVILRNLFQNPGWYTQYTPYQAEIAQGRLESLLNFQTMICDLTGLPIANASLLDEATAAAEAMHMFYAERNKRSSSDHQANEFFADESVFPQTLDVLRTRAKPYGIRLVIGDWRTYVPSERTFGVLLQYPNREGAIEDYRAFVEQCKATKTYVCVAADILSLTLLKPPGEWGADCAVGNTQRFGVPIGFGGPHAAYFATTEEFKRLIPGRIIGVSIDRHGNRALRMALQTREQHIRREKATSNICTAQALLANMAAMYAVYHGPKGLRSIAQRIHDMTKALAAALEKAGFLVAHSHYFDTLRLNLKAEIRDQIYQKADAAGINFFYDEKGLQISLDETVTDRDLADIAAVFGAEMPTPTNTEAIPTELQRETPYLTHPVFNSYHTESEMMRYLKRLENRDLSLTHSMISLGSCTMKLNAATEMIPLSWESWANIHPFAPASQTQGYQKIICELEQYLCEITGFEACSLQPNSGAQGEYTGLMVIRAYHESRGEGHRNVALIPSSAHGTNPASAVMAGMQVVVVSCDERGNIDVKDLRRKAEQFSDHLACLMVTYPSTHGVFETAICDICEIIHQHGGLVYMDGANMNAQVGLTSPAAIGADVCHLNLHKTFAIPHGGGGPGMGPICCNTKLAPFLPGHPLVKTGGSKAITAVSAAPWGSASILLISYAYIKMLGAEGLTNATKYAILNANYVKARLEGAYPILYSGENGRCAHEMIVDLRPFKSLVSAEDVAKRLMDYGFHAPTLSFPVAGTIMIEPTESESKAELDRFCDALLAIRREIDEIAEGKYSLEDNPLRNAPHTAQMVCADEWPHTYSREQAAFPLPYLRQGWKFWPTVSRIDQAYGDRNLVCVCPPVEAYEMA
ncbi:MAG: aminomethyl-transferring glycine dehydrogenase [Saprospiraceae bacterium]|nr:aminomethyl-transferring glycine dehydrogenase [Saprospiraceae bacterium]MDW8483455.1 aminomethyl-transferring glycine dehydrogenase [Saprospiraceae bacterium]